MSAQHRLAVTYRSASPWLDYEVDRLDRLAIYDLASYRAVASVPDRPARDGCTAWTKDGEWLIVGLHHGSVLQPQFGVYDADTMTEDPGWSPLVTSTAISRVAAGVGHFAIITGADLKVARVWSFATKTNEINLTMPAEISHLEFSPNGAYLAISTSSILRIYDTATWGVVSGTPTVSGAWRHAWSPNGAYFAVAQDASGTALRLYDAATWAEIPTGINSPEWSISLSWRGDSAALCIGLVAAPHALVVAIPSMIAQPVTMPAGVSTGFDDTLVSMGPAGHLAVCRFEPGAWHATILAPDLATVVSDGWPIARKPTGFAWAPAPAYTLSGTVVDADEAPAAGRTLLAIHDAGSTVVATAVSGVGGAFALATPHADGHTVMLIEDGGRAQVLGSGVLPL